MKRVLLKLTVLSLAALLALAFAPIFRTTAGADSEYGESNGFIYSGDSNGCTIIGYEGTEMGVIIPDTIEGVRVVAIGEGAFCPYMDCIDGITSVTFPTLTADELANGDSVLIDDGAFDEQPDLATVDLANSGNINGKDVFEGDTAIAAFSCASDNPYAAAQDGVLFSKDMSELTAYPPAKADTAYTIPAGVTSIADDCFSGGCTNISAFAVDPSNTAFSAADGVLFNQAQTQLVLYPPQGTASYTIPGTVTSLADGAFGLADNLTSVSIPAGVTDLGSSIETGNKCNPFYNSPKLSAITVDAGNTAFILDSEGALLTKDGKTLVCYPAGRASTDPTDYTVKRPAPPAKTESASGRLSGSAAGSLPEKISEDFSKAEQSKKPQAAKTTVTPVERSSGMTGNYIVPDSVQSIWEYAFYNTNLAAVTFDTGSNIGKNGGSIDDEAFPQDGSVSICTYADDPSTLFNVLKSFAEDNDVPFIELSNLAGDLGYNVDDSTNNAIITGFNEEYEGDEDNVTIPTTITDDQGTHTVVAIADGAFQGRYIEHVAIPNTVTSLGAGAFADCDLYGTLKIPDSVTSIGDGCFQDCNELTAVVMPGNKDLTSLGADTFSGCDSLSDIVIPSSITSIGDGCFTGCAFVNLTIPDSVTSIGQGCFSGCEGLQSITLPSGLASLEDETFFDCESLQGIVIPDTVASIGANCFQDCKKLPSIAIPKNVAEIGQTAFLYCDSLQSFDVAADNQAFIDTDGVLFSKDGTTLVCYPSAKAGVSYAIPSTVTAVEDFAFSGTDACPLTSISVPASVVSADKAFISASLQAITVDSANAKYANYNGDGILYDKNITKIICYPLAKKDSVYNIPATIRSLGAWALSECKFQTVNIPAGLTSIGNGAMSFCASLLNINADPHNAVYASKGGVLFNKKITAVVQFPGGRAGEYSIPGGVTTVMNYAFMGGSINRVDFPASVTTLGAGAFAFNCQNTDLDLGPDMGTGLDMAVFYGNPYKYTPSTDPDFPDLGPFDGANYDFTVYYHISKAAKWSNYNGDYDSSPFCNLTLNFQDGLPNQTSFAAIDGYNGHIDYEYEPEDPTRPGCTFAGWFTDAACKHAWNFDTGVVKNDLTLYALWMIDTPPSVDAEPQNYNTLKVSWTLVDNAAGYVVKRSTSLNGKYTTIATTKANVSSYINKNVTTGVTYYYTLTAFTQAGKNKFYGNQSTPVSAFTTLQKPNQPSAKILSYKSVKISWSKVPGATKYIVCRATQANPSDFISIKTVTSTSYTDNNAMIGTYYYAVKAVRGGAVSDLSDAKEVETVLPAPAIKVVKTGTDVYTVSWKAVNGASGYDVYVDGGSTPVTKTKYVLSGLPTGETHDIYVVAFRTIGGVHVPSDDSNDVQVTP